MFQTNLLFILMLLLSSSVTTTFSRGCDRSRSRLVRKVVYEKLLPAFVALNTELSDDCEFSPAHDRYRTQETHKTVEEGTKWYCGFCGKAFVTEYFLDLHFDNRHADFLEEENAVCLEDVCDVFRCDVLSGQFQPDYWDVALCLEDDMKTLHRKCQSMVKNCVPSGLTSNETNFLNKVTIEELCSYLTCSKYWEIPFESDGPGGMTALYIILTVLISFGVFIYYCVFYTYFYTDAFSDAIAYEPGPKSKHRTPSYQPELRQRPRAFPSPSPD